MRWDRVDDGHGCSNRALTSLLRLADTAVVSNDPVAIAAVLAENLRELTATIERLTPSDLDRRLAQAEWSVREVLLHVIHAERWLQPQLAELREAVAPERAALLSDAVRLPAADSAADVNELRWAVNAVREDTCRLLEGLEPAQLREPGIVEVAGETEDASQGVDVSLRTLLLTIADHQLFHVRQLERILDSSA